jgi:hypothetical protein
LEDKGLAGIDTPHIFPAYFVKFLVLFSLPEPDRRVVPQNIENKQFSGKLLQHKDLAFRPEGECLAVVVDRV